MQNKYSDKNIKDALKRIAQNSYPDEKWTHDTLYFISNLSKTEKVNSRKTGSVLDSILIYFHYPMKKAIFAVTAFTAVGIFALGGGFLAYSKYNSKSLALSAAEKDEIFRNIIQNNSTSVLSNESQNSRNSAETLSADQKMSASYGTSMPAGPLTLVEGDYSYYYNRVEPKTGPKLGLCKVFDNQYSDEVTYEDYSYYDKNTNDSYSKGLSFFSDGSLMNYYLSSYNSDQSISYEYKGGDYAVKTTYIYDPANKVSDTDMGLTEPGVDSETSEEELSIDQKIEMYFGPDADIVRKENENGREYFVIQYSYEVNCDQEFYILDLRVASEPVEPQDMTNIKVEQWVDSETYRIGKSKSFVGEFGDANLAFELNFKSDVRNTAFGDVASNFNFDYDVEVKEVVYDYRNAQEKERQKLVDVLKGENISILSSDTLTLDYISSPKTWESAVNYYADRNFYPDGARGDEEFNNNNTPVTPEPWFDEAIASLSFSHSTETEFKSIYVNVHKTDKDNATLMKNYSSEGEVKEENVNITVNGKTLTAVKYTFTFKQSPEISTLKEDAVSSSDTTLIAPCDNPECTYTSVYYLIEVDGFKNVISLSNVAESDLKFTSLKMSSDEAKIMELINKSYDKTSGRGTEPMPL